MAIGTMRSFEQHFRQNNNVAELPLVGTARTTADSTNFRRWQ